MNCGGVILCGGESSRMGYPKDRLPFGPETMLGRVARLLGEVVSPLVFVAAPGQPLDSLPGGQLVRDRREGRGPLEGMAAGLAALQGQAEAAYVTSCDVPLLVPDFVRRMIALAEGYQIAVPYCEGFHHPLAAVYRLDVLPQVEALLAAGRLRPRMLFDAARTRVVQAEELADVDPQLRSLRNLNRAEDYLAALEAAGFAAPDEVLARLRNTGGEND